MDVSLKSNERLGNSTITVDLGFAQLFSKLLELEDAQHFFQVVYRGIPFWDLIRAHVLVNLYAELTQASKTVPDSFPWRMRVWNLLVNSIPQRNPWMMPHKEFLFWGHSRRQLQDDGFFWDIYLDPLIDTNESRLNYIEEAFQCSHFTPPRTRQPYYNDAMNLLNIFPRYLSEKRRSDDSGIRHIEGKLNSTFGTSINIVDLAKREALRFSYNRKLFRKLLKKKKA